MLAFGVVSWVVMGCIFLILYKGAYNRGYNAGSTAMHRKWTAWYWMVKS